MQSPHFQITKYLIAVFLFTACAQPKEQLKAGDLLFVSYATGKLTKAIDDVTHTQKDRSYAHVAIVLNLNHELQVLEATTENGVGAISIRDFLQKHAEAGNTVDLFRLQKLDAAMLNEAAEVAKDQLGKPYNFAYLWQDSAVYCSQLVYYCFQDAGVFGLDPMTFKDTETGELLPFWIDYYQKLKIPVPEGKPGCNPNGLAADEDVKFIKTISPEEL
ncbi:hypothetical protein GC194_00595 [bacterium]|nr:hypothetical protein [bacterium]